MNHVMRLNLPRAAPPAKGRRMGFGARIEQLWRGAHDADSRLTLHPLSSLRHLPAKRCEVHLQAKRPSQNRAVLLPPATFIGLAIDS
jgi:hypothetical protein